MKSSLSKVLLLSSAMMVCFSPLSAHAGDTPESLIKDGAFFGQTRYRYETVDQDGFANKANASTVRMNVGFKTGVYQNFQGLLEGQIVQNMGANDFNDSINGKTTYPAVTDPNIAEINQAWASWAGLPKSVVKVGRQEINLDNQRFIGSVNWRQNDQIFDSVLLTNNSIPNLDLAYGYVWNVNRIQGHDFSLGDLHTQTHIAHAAYKVADWLTATGYGYLLDIKRSSALSSQTYGVRLTGDVPVTPDWAFFYTAEAANQNDYGNSTISYDENYFHILPGVKGHGFTVQAGYEELGGDGANAFQTPLATLHAFNGWADKFLTTPGRGLEDAYGLVSYKFTNENPWVKNTILTAVYHDFNGDTSGDFGNETDLSVGRSFEIPEFPLGKNLDVLLKYADYNGDDAAYRDAQKTWVQVGIKF